MADGLFRLIAPMPGKVIAVLVGVGDDVAAGQELVTLESMKMEVPVKASAPGTVAGINVLADDRVKQGDVMIELSP